MGLNIFLLFLGIALLYLGSEWMVKGSASLAMSFSIRPVIVGLTVVAFATSAPELVVSLLAAVSGASDVSLGNILGSNVANLGLVLGTSALVRPLTVDRTLVRREVPFMIGVSVIFWILSWDGRIGRVDGGILLAGLAFFLVVGIMTAGSADGTVAVQKKGRIWNLVLVLVGMAGLIVGAELLVKSAIYIATWLGLSELFIGLTIVAVGTSLPELATSVVAGARAQYDISIGNVVGSNIFNICMVMGMVGLFNPINVETGILKFEFPFMLVLSIILLVFCRTGYVISRLEGLLFLFGYGAFVGVSYWIRVG
jgi:cation:H+ antiporter